MKIFWTSEDMREHTQNELKDTSKWPQGKDNMSYILLVFFTIRVIARISVQNIIKNIKQITLNREKYLKMAPNDPKIACNKVQDPIKCLSV